MLVALDLAGLAACCGFVPIPDEMGWHVVL
jgi:hypothetical protein